MSQDNFFLKPYNEVEALAKKSENTIETSKIPLQGEQAQKE